jgi:hypothetical protein
VKENRNGLNEKRKGKKGRKTEKAKVSGIFLSQTKRIPTNAEYT